MPSNSHSSAWVEDDEVEPAVLPDIVEDSDVVGLPEEAVAGEPVDELVTGVLDDKGVESVDASKDVDVNSGEVDFVDGKFVLVSVVITVVSVGGSVDVDAGAGVFDEEVVGGSLVE